MRRNNAEGKKTVEGRCESKNKKKGQNNLRVGENGKGNLRHVEEETLILFCDVD